SQRHRILTQVSGDHMEVIKLIPPLMIGDTEVKLFTEAFGEVLEDASKGSGLIWEFGRTLVKAAPPPLTRRNYVISSMSWKRMTPNQSLLSSRMLRSTF